MGPGRALSLIALGLVSVLVSTLPAAAQPRRLRPSRISVEGTPAGAEVHLDGEFVGVLPLDGPVEVSPGSHTVRVVSPGFTEFNDVVEVRPARRAQLFAELLPVTMSLLLLTEPESARVFVDGDFAGETPVTLDLLEGDRHIRVERFGYYEQVFSVVAVVGAADTRELNLVPLPLEERERLEGGDSEWYEEPLPWALIGGGAAIVAATIAAIVVVTSEGTTEQESFCEGGSFPCAVFEF